MLSTSILNLLCLRSELSHLHWENSDDLSDVTAADGTGLLLCKHRGGTVTAHGIMATCDSVKIRLDE